MKWLLLWAISGLAIALGYAVWRRWIAPWSRVENMIRQVARGERIGKERPVICRAENCELVADQRLQETVEPLCTRAAENRIEIRL